MERSQISSKLVVILHADVAGSTALVRLDEQQAHQQIKQTFQNFAQIIAGYHGQVNELRGDALLAEFDRASDAVAAALAFQQQQSGSNAEFADTTRPEVRVGIALGEVVIDRDTVTGAGVVIAQRLEQMAEPGGVVIQGAAYETIPERFPFKFSSIGNQEIKGFDDSIRAFRVEPVEGQAIPGPQLSTRTNLATGSRKWIAAGTVGMVVAVLVAIAWFRPEQRPPGTAPVGSISGVASERPKIAVLPFVNLSGGEEQEYFADGMTEDLITDLSKVSGLFVIARNSTFSYKGQPVDVRRVAKDLGVRYVLEGSVRRSGDKIRINAQLIDATSGGHLWADRFDGDWGDVFGMQDAITEKIVDALAVELETGERDQIARQYTNSVEAYDYFLRGRDHFSRRNRDDNRLAASLFVEAIELDPAFAQAYSLLAWAQIRDVINGWTASPESSLDEAREAARKAIELDARLAQAYFVRSLIFRTQRDHVQAAREAEKAIEIDPGYADAYVLLASLLYYSGGAEDGLKLIQKAKQLNPNYPSNYPFHLGQAYFLLHRYEDAAAAFQAALETNPTSERSRVWLAATYGQAGQIDDAEFEVEEILALDPDFSIQRMRDNIPLKVPDDIEHFIAGLQKAGLPN